jgi:CBS domain-containing protein
MDKKIAKDNMSSPLITIGWNERMESAYRRMQTQRVRHLPVTDESGEIIGVLSDRDVQRSMISKIDRPVGQILSDETIQFDAASRVRDYMSWPAKSVDLRADLRSVAARMVDEKVSSILVYDGSTPVGIVTAEDLLKVLIELLSDPRAQLRWTLEQVLDGAFTQLKSTLV